MGLEELIEMNEDELLPYAIRRYDQEYQRNQNIDSKASNQIGFVGVIIGIFGFILSDGLTKNHFMYILIIGISILLGSIIISSLSLFPRKKIPALKIKSYLDYIRNGKKVLPMIDVLIYQIDKMNGYNTTKTRKIKWSFILMFIGLTISFIGTIYSII